MTAEIGSPAPQFTLRDQDRNEVSLADFRGRKTLVVFIPFPFSRICQSELCAVRDNLHSLNSADANVVVIACDTIFVHKKWAEIEGFEFPILSDFWPHGATASAYGVFNEDLGVAKRSTFVLDEDGVVRSVVATDSLGQAREFTDYPQALASI